MKTSSLFVIGLVIGAMAVFALRAVALREEPAAAPGATAQEAGHAGHAPSLPAPAPAAGPAPAPAPVPAPAPAPAPQPEAGDAPAEGSLLLTLASDGELVRAVMGMPGGAQHPIEPGGHAPMGDYPARIVGREGTFQAHLHPDGSTRIEVTVRDAAGATVAGGDLVVRAGTPPENRICPVMGNEINADLYVDYKGRRIAFCCAGCDETFLQDPAKYLKKLDAERAARKGND